nr:amidase family protein [Glutamicibacter soli]
MYLRSEESPDERQDVKAQQSQGIWTYLPKALETSETDPNLTGPEPEFDFAVKANIEVAAMPASAGSPVFSDYFPDIDSPVVAILKRHGGQVAGLTNMHELAFGMTSDNATFGPVRNPFDHLRSAGGSSGGSAACVAAGLVPLSLGTDTGGSISIPASVCGVVGFRPSTGRWPTAGTIGLSWTRDTIGVHAKSVEHVAMVDTWISHNSASSDMSAPSTDKPILGIPTAFTKDLDPAVASRFAEVRQLLSAHLRILDIDLDEVIAATDSAQWDIVGYEAPRCLSTALATAEDIAPTEAWKYVVSRAASPDVRNILESYDNNPVDDESYTRAIRTADAAHQRYCEILDAAGIDALIFPSLPALPALLRDDDLVMHRGTLVPLFPLFTRHVGPGTVMGVPSVSLPAGLVDAGGGVPLLPVGVNVQGFAHRDSELLTIASQLETLLEQAFS